MSSRKNRSRAGDSFDISRTAAVERSQMRCPSCWAEMLEEHPDITHEYSTEFDKLVYATRCGNPACDRDRVNPSDIREQMPKSNRLLNTIRVEGVVPFVVVLLIAISAVVVAFYLVGFVGPVTPMDIDVFVVSPSNSPVGDIRVTIGDQSVVVDSEGEGVVSGVVPGERELIVRTPPTSEYGSIGPVGIVVNDGSYIVDNNRNARYTSEGLRIELSQISEYMVSGGGVNQETAVEFGSVLNAERGVWVSVSGGGDEVEQTREVIPGEETQVNVVGEITSQEARVYVPVVEGEFVERGTYTSTETVVLRGSERPTDVSISVDSPTRVTVNSQVVCSEGEVQSNAGVCSIPSSVLTQGNVVTLVLGDTGVSYELQYTVQTTASRVIVRTDEGRFTITRDEGTREDGFEGWVGVIDGRVLRAGENVVSVFPERSDGLDTAARVELTYLVDSPAPENPVVVVTDASGEQSQIQVTGENVEDGVLRGDARVRIPADAFSEGKNTIRVTSSNEASMFVEIRFESVVFQSPSIKDV